MKTKWRRIWLACLISALTPWCGCTSDLTIVSTQAGGWQIQLDESDLVWGAGSDLAATYTSTAACDLLTVITDDPDTSWCIVIALQHSIDPFSLEVRVSDEGNGDSPVISSSDFQVVTTENSTLLSGTGSRWDMSVQYRVSGCSIETMTATQYLLDLSYMLCL